MECFQGFSLTKSLMTFFSVFLFCFWSLLQLNLQWFWFQYSHYFKYQYLPSSVLGPWDPFSLCFCLPSFAPDHLWYCCVVVAGRRLVFAYGGQRLTSDVFLSLSPPHFLGQGFWSWWSWSSQICWTGWPESLGSACLSFSSAVRMELLCYAFYMGARCKFRSACWAFSHPPCFLILLSIMSLCLRWFSLLFYVIKLCLPFRVQVLLL